MVLVAVVTEAQTIIAA